MISSDVATSNKTFKVTTPTISASTTTDTTAKLTVTPTVIPGGEDASYVLEVIEYNDTDKFKPEYGTPDARKVSLTKESDGSYTITADRLDANKKYVFRLVVTVDGIEAKSAYTSAVQTKKSIPAIEKLTVTTTYEDALKANSGKVAVSTNDAGTKVIAINGTEYEYESADYTNGDLERNATIIAELKDGDVVTIKADKVTLILNDNKEGTRDFSSLDMDEFNLDVTCNDEHAKTIKGTFKNVTLNGSKAIYETDHISVAQDGRLVIGSGVDARGNNTYTVGSNAMINNVGVTTKVETTIASTVNANTVTLDVTANTQANTLSFVNTTKNTTIKFVGLSNHSSIQDGTINIASEGNGTVTLRSSTLANTGVNIKANINVTANAGTVDIQEPNLNGTTKQIHVTKAAKAVVTAKYYTESEAPVALRTFAVDSTDAQIKTVLGIANADEDLTDTEKESIAELKAYLAEFGLEGKEAKVTVAAGSNAVTVSFAAGDTTTDATIDNIK